MYAFVISFSCLVWDWGSFIGRDNSVNLYILKNKVKKNEQSKASP